MPVDHYENFPVASWLLPAPLRPPVEAIYGFARGADDIADEGDASAAERLAGLERYRGALRALAEGRDPPREFARIAWAVARYELPIPLLADLIDAFGQDVVKKRYASFEELLDYARRSANPVGRLLLHVFAKTGQAPTIGDRPLVAQAAAAARGSGAASPVFSASLLSDRICTGLQLANFWQDVALDWKKGRVYIPQEDLARFGVREESIARGLVDERWTALMAFECARTRAMLLEGSALGRALPGRVGLEIRATVEGGLAILDRIGAVRGDVFRRRPVLGPAAWVRILTRALLPKAAR